MNKYTMNKIFAGMWNVVRTEKTGVFDIYKYCFDKDLERLEIIEKKKRIIYYVGEEISFEQVKDDDKVIATPSLKNKPISEIEIFIRAKSGMLYYKEDENVIVLDPSMFDENGRYLGKIEETKELSL